MAKGRLKDPFWCKKGGASHEKLVPKWSKKATEIVAKCDPKKERLWKPPRDQSRLVFVSKMRSKCTNIGARIDTRTVTDQKSAFSLPHSKTL